MSTLSRSRPAEVAHFPVEHTDAEWRTMLPPETYRVMRKHGTERAGSSALEHEHRSGVYVCAACHHALFPSSTKFDSGTGWPSFFRPLASAVETKIDHSLFMPRTEVHCSQCGGHLGHVFEDGPAPTHERYCMNGASLAFTPD